MTASERMADQQTNGAGRPGAERRWYLWLALIALGGMITPAIWILRSKHPVGFNDAFYFYDQARFIFNGAGWFIQPFAYVLSHQANLPGASHPPLWTLVLVLGDALGLRSYVAQLLWSCLVGGVAIVVTGLAAREIAGPRVGLIAGFLAAIYPNYWINYGLGLGETLLLVLIPAVILVSIRLSRRPSYPKAVVLGLLCALAALTRAEQTLLVVLVLVPVIALMRPVSPRRRAAYAAVGVGTALVVVAPWVGFNMARFSHPTYLSTDSGFTLATANCSLTYSGPWIGYEAVQCLSGLKIASGDESVEDAQLRHVGLTYARAHIGEVPLVMTARVGRELGLFQPLQQLRLERFINGRPYTAALIGLVMFYAMSVLGVLGLIMLRRQRITLVPFLGVLVGVILASMVTFGETRYRVPLDVVVVVLSAVALDGLASWTRARRALSSPDQETLA
jgi:hypothetical protein